MKVRRVMVLSMAALLPATATLFGAGSEVADGCLDEDGAVAGCV